MDYLSDVHQLELDAFPIPDVNEIGEKQDEEQMGRLLQLVLGIAIHCDGKEGLELCTLYPVLHAIHYTCCRIHPSHSINGRISPACRHGSHTTLVN